MGKRTVPLLELLDVRFKDIARKELFARIMCGEVQVDGETVRDPKAPASPSANLSFNRRTYVSRGGEKLAGAIRGLGLCVEGRVYLDAGSSTGGFTDCLLAYGACAVHAVDVGRNQLDYRLRSDPRVHVHEEVNIMDVDMLDPSPEAAVADLSFRSLRGAARKILGLTRNDELVALFKPQYELGGAVDAFDGVVRDHRDIQTALESLLRDLNGEGVYVTAAFESPVRGRQGNREFFLSLTTTPSAESFEALGALTQMISGYSGRQRD